MAQATSIRFDDQNPIAQSAAGQVDAYAAVQRHYVFEDHGFAGGLFFKLQIRSKTLSDRFLIDCLINIGMLYPVITGVNDLGGWCGLLLHEYTDPMSATGNDSRRLAIHSELCQIN